MKEHTVKKTSLANLKNECRAYFNRAKYYNSEASWDIYHTKLSLYKKEIRTSKRRACASFCSRIESTAKASRLRRILAKSPASIFYLKTAADSWTESSHETVELLLDTHFPINLDDQSIDNITNPGRIKWAINSFKPFKSPGPDGFFASQLQRTLDISLLWLTAIFHGCLVPSHIPTRWLDVKVIFIPKAGKPSISLTSFTLKTLKRLIDIHIRLTINPILLSNAQHAYRGL